MQLMKICISGQLTEA